MQSVIESSLSNRKAGNLRRSEPIAEFPFRFGRHVAVGATVFQPGEQRRLYRVESGAVCHYFQGADGQYEVIEFAFPDDIIGLGYLPTHVSTAKAIVETCLSVITDADLDHALSNDNRLFFRLADAGEREFEYVRDSSLDANQRSPIQRIANFLLAITAINASEGRDPMIVAEDVSSGYVAKELHVSIETLATELNRLRRRGLVDVSVDGLRILDVAGLETLVGRSA